MQKVEEKYPVLDSAPAGGGSYKTRIGEIYPVHGTLVSNLIMGVDNFSQLDCSNITITEKLRRTLLKPVVNDELGRNEHEKAKQLIKSSSFLFFYGLSFGATDISWWEVIREKIISDAECQIVVFTRSTEDDIQEIIPEDVLDYVSDKKEEFLAQIGILTSDVNYEGVWKRVFIVRNTKRLPISIQEIKEPATT